jgi:hypothetical protein
MTKLISIDLIYLSSVTCFLKEVGTSKPGLLTLCALNTEPDNSVAWHPVHCGGLSSIPGLYQLDASGISPL